MKKKGASNRVAARVGAALAFVIVAVLHTRKVAAVKRGRWPRPTCYSVVAHPGDTARAIAARHRVSPSLVAKVNALKATRGAKTSRRATVIGTAGTTDGVVGPQLHFEIRRGITPMDPILLLAANS